MILVFVANYAARPSPFLPPLLLSFSLSRSPLCTLFLGGMVNTLLTGAALRVLSVFFLPRLFLFLPPLAIPGFLLGSPFLPHSFGPCEDREQPPATYTQRRPTRLSRITQAHGTRRGGSVPPGFLSFSLIGGTRDKFESLDSRNKRGPAKDSHSGTLGRLPGPRNRELPNSAAADRAVKK